MSEVFQRIQAQLDSPRLADNLTPLFCETLRWGNPRGLAPRAITVGAPLSRNLTTVPVAQLSGLPVFRVDWPDDRPPTLTQRRAVHRAIAPVHAEHLLCYVTRDRCQAAFVWARRRSDDKTELRTLPYETGSPARTTIERLGELAFNLNELARGEPPIGVVTDRLNAAFNVEKVTEDFFEDYKKVFAELQSRLARTTRDKVWAHDYALQFLNRLMFLYFIQRKRWLGDDSRFLGHFWETYKASRRAKDSFFEAWLCPLFFEAFNNKFQAGRTDRAHFPPEVRSALAAAPFLNGGLFAHNRLDEAQEPALTDDFFAMLFDRFEGDQPGFLERYNFTISEATPFDVEVAVDPEMIGKVYESLVNITFEGLTEEDLRGTAGIFFTPRVEIDLMCRLAVVDYLANHLGEKYKPLLYDAVFAYDAAAKERADRALADQNLWPQLSRLLREVTICDIACGSGSFLVGMLLVLDDLQARANAQLGIEESPYERRRRIIGEQLYGVDVMDWAVHVAELRLWLQLVIETDLKPAELKFRPLLPNLSFKVRQGDSLVQEIGGINFGLHRAHLDLPPDLKGRLTRFKGEKLKFYQGDPDCRFRSEALLKQEELRLFRDLIHAKHKRVTDELADIRRRLQATTKNLLGETVAVADDKSLQVLREQQAVYEIEHDHIQRASEALRAVRDDRPGTVPFVWDIAFVEIFEGDKEGFDIVVGNPPYVRQEMIAPPDKKPEDHGGEKSARWKQLKAEYKAKLQESVAAAWSRFFGYKPGSDRFRKPDGKSDLYIYFYLHGLALLNPKGSFCFITSNSWLDVGYGAELQEFLLKHGHVKLILDNERKRSFSQADVNTIIALLAPPEDRRASGLNNTARFVMFKAPFEDILDAATFKEIEAATERSVSNRWRQSICSQRQLLEEGLAVEEGEDEDQPSADKRPKSPLIKTARYDGNKWGGKYLRAPDVFFAIVEKLKKIGRPLGDFVWGQRYLNTGGADGFFIFTTFREPRSGEYIEVANESKEGRERGSPTFLIEREFLRPAIKSTDIGNLVVTKPDALVLDIPPETANLSRKEVYKYIKWGEAAGFDERSVTSIQTPWWKAPRQARESGPLLLMRNYNDVHKSFYNPKRFIAVRFYRLYPHDRDHEKPLAAILNTTYFALFREIYGSTKLGLGALDATMADMKRVPIPFPLDDEFRKELSKRFDTISKRPVGNVEFEKGQRDRRALDDLVFDALGLTAGEREAVYEAVVNLVRARLEKAQSV